MKKYNVEFTTTLIIFADNEDDACEKATSEMNEAGVNLVAGGFEEYTEEVNMEGFIYEVRQLDMWHTEDEWTENNSMVIGKVLIDYDMEDDDIINLLIEEGYLAKVYKGKVTFSEWSDGRFEIVRVDNDEPILALIQQMD